MKGEVKSEVSLKRALGLFTSTLLVIGLVIGSGVFKKIVPMAQTGLSEVAILRHGCSLVPKLFLAR